MIGQTLAHFRILDLLGQGGMGEVYRAEDLKLGRQVAIKVLPEAFTENAERLARFEREAQLLAQLQHQNIASIYGLEESDGKQALVMELVEGASLDERLEAGALPIEESLGIARQIAEALEEAHDKGIVHRDLKPQNIKVSPEGKVKILDFGLAKAMDPGTSSTSVADLARSPTLLNSPTLTAVPGTQLGVILGTAAYMAPEQARGSAVDKRADIWAFGVVLYEMVAGRSLFASATVTDTLASVLKTEVDFSQLPASTKPALRRLLRRCLERNPRNRLHDIADARIVLDELLSGEGDDAFAETTTARRSVPLPMAAFMAFLVALGSYLVGHRGSSPPSLDEASGASSPTFEKLTARPGLETNPVLSPDGKTLYFVATHADRDDTDIYFVPVGGTKPIDLTADSPTDESYPAVSPDGRQIAFRSDRDGGGIFLMGTTGESVRRLVDGCFDPAWSPDGQQIACTTFAADDPFNRGGDGRLRLVEVGSGAFRELESGDAAAPTWSPDGRRLVYWGLGDESGWRDLFTLAIDGGEPVTLTHDAAVDWNPLWSDDGSAVTFLSDRGGAPNLWRLQIDPADGRPLGPPTSLLLPTEFASEIRRSGNRWVYVSRSLRTTIGIQGFDPDRLALVGTRRSIVDTTGRTQYFSISPDGSIVAYSSLLPQQDLYVVDAEGGTPVQLTNDRAIDRFPSWDPNGERIVFMTNRGGRYDMWAIRPDGSGLEQLTRMTEESRWNPQLSPDRKRLSTTSERGLTVLDAGNPPPWTRFERFSEPPTESAPQFDGWSWSPDGTRIAGAASVQNGIRVAYWSFPENRLHSFEVEGEAAAWFPDGRRIVISRGEGGLRVLDIESGEALPVAGGGDGFENRVSMSADLRSIVTYRNLEEADIWLAEGIE